MTEQITAIRQALNFILATGEHDSNCGAFDLDEEGRHCVCTCGLRKTIDALRTAIEQARSAPIAFAGYHTMTDKIEIFMTEKQAIDWRDQYQPGFARVEKLVSNGVVE